jgi:hypothetical protein
MISWLFFNPDEAGIADMGKIIRVTNAPNIQIFQDTGQNLQLILAQTVTPHLDKKYDAGKKAWIAIMRMVKSDSTPAANWGHSRDSESVRYQRCAGISVLAG